MPSPIDILLKVGADVRDAVRGIEKVEDAAKRADKEVEKVGTRIRNAAQRGTGRAGDAFAQILNGSNPESVVRSLLPSLGLGALAAAMAEYTSRVYNDILEKKITDATEDLGLAASPSAAGTAFGELAAGRAAKPEGRVSQTRQAFRVIGDVLTGKAGVSALGNVKADTTELGRAVRSEFRTIAEADPLYAAAILANLPANLAPFYDDLSDILAEAQTLDQKRKVAGDWRASLRTSGHVVVNQSTTNVYSTFSGLGGDAAVGREVRSVLDRRERNNGRYVNVYSRR